MNTKSKRYIPALSYDWLTPLYDPLVGGLLRDSVFKRRLVEQARITAGQRVLDLGCGTATLTILIKSLHPRAEVIGLDGDAKVLRIARSKARRARVEIALDHGMAFDLPYPDGCLDRALSSLVFHHLTTEDKRRTAREVVRVLRPGGELHVADFGRPHNPLMYLVSLVTRRFEQVGDNIEGRLPGMFRDAGLVDVTETARYATLFGTLVLYKAVKPANTLDDRSPR